MLELQVVPEQHVGNEQWDFVLGMHLGQVISIIKSQVKLIHAVHFVTSEQAPLLVDTTIDLSEDGLRLVFCSKQQRLKRIEVYDMQLVKLKYCGQFFSSGVQVVPTLQQIEQSFGPTQPVVYNSDCRSLVMNFRGICFFFPVESGNEFGTSPDRSGLSSLKYNKTTEPVVEKMCIFSGNNLPSAVLPELPLRCFYGNVFAESVRVLRQGGHTQGLELDLVSEGRARADGELEIVQRQVTIRFGDNTQTVQSLLGSPCKTHYKCEDKMKIHSSSPHKMSTTKSDYFFNYFTLGLDILFDASCHTIKKFVLHTNFPGHFDFEIYNRCKFTIPLDLELSGSSEAVDLVAEFSSSAMQFSPDEPFTVEACTKWEDIVDAIGGRQPSTPVVLSRTSSTNAVNPFGPSLCYHYQNIIFEVIQQSGHIAAVTLYPTGE